jgi:hypothetical protein
MLDANASRQSRLFPRWIPDPRGKMKIGDLIFEARGRCFEMQDMGLANRDSRVTVRGSVCSIGEGGLMDSGCGRDMGDAASGS